jgi:hypothetical protein
MEQLLERVKMALAGEYHARNYSDLEIELATVIYKLGGDAALHALHFVPMMHVDPIPSFIFTTDMVTLHSGLNTLLATSILTLSPFPSPYQFLHTRILFMEILMMFFFEKTMYIRNYMVLFFS